MDPYRMNYYGCRNGRMPARQESCPREMTETIKKEQMVPAMGYVPMQHFEATYELSRGFMLGTIFPELCKPFCGKGGGGC